MDQFVDILILIENEYVFEVQSGGVIVHLPERVAGSNSGTRIATAFAGDDGEGDVGEGDVDGDEGVTDVDGDDGECDVGGRRRECDVDGDDGEGDVGE